MAGVGLNEFYEARRKEMRFQERSLYSQSGVRPTICSTCNQCGCSSSCPRYHAYAYGTPYVSAYQRQNGAISSRGNARGFQCELHPEKRSDRIHAYDRMNAHTESQPGTRYLTGVLPKRYQNFDYMSQH